MTDTPEPKLQDDKPKKSWIKAGVGAAAIGSAAIAAALIYSRKDKPKK